MRLVRNDMLALLLLAALAQVGRPVSAVTCAERVETLLRAVGAVSPLRLVHAGRVFGGKRAWWEVGVVDARRGHYVATLDLSGHVTSLVRARADHGRGLNIRRLTEPRYTHLVRGWLAHFGADPQVKLGPILADENGKGYARFSILRAGHPFVAQPPYAYDLTFTVPKGEFLGFTARENPPPVTLTTPRITQAQAAASVKPPPSGTRQLEFRPKGVAHQVAHRPELAWFLPPDASHAILVWRIAFENYGEAAHKRRYADSQVIIDATTGQRIAPWLAH